MMSMALCTLTFVIAVNSGVLWILQRYSLDPWRRTLQFAVLASPLVVVVAFPWREAACAGSTCSSSAVPAPIADALLLLPLILAFCVLCGCILGFARIALVARSGRVGCVAPGADLFDLFAKIAGQLGVTTPRLSVQISTRPVAFTIGVLRPTVIISTWFLDHFDQEELEAVLAHELAHVRRRDFAAAWAATLLRDAFWYLPTSRTAYSALQAEKEVACDDLAVAATRDRLGLASALTKVWCRAAVRSDRMLPLVALAGPNAEMEGRIARLLAASSECLPSSEDEGRSFIPRVTAKAGMLLAVIGSVVILLALTGCMPYVPLMH